MVINVVWFHAYCGIHFFLIINLVAALLFGLHYVAADATQINNYEELKLIDVALTGQKHRRLDSTPWKQQTSAAQWSVRDGLTSVVVGNSTVIMGGSSFGKLY